MSKINYEPSQERYRRPYTDEVYHLGEIYDFLDVDDAFSVWVTGRLTGIYPKGDPRKMFEAAVNGQFRCRFGEIKKCEPEQMEIPAVSEPIPRKKRRSVTDCGITVEVSPFIKHIDIDIYKHVLVFCYGVDKAKVLKHIEDYPYQNGVARERIDSALDCIKSIDFTKCNGVTISDTGAGITIVYLNNENKDKLGTLVHELLHAVSDIGYRVGLKMNEDTMEAFCYLQQYLFNECYKLIQPC